MLRNKSGKVRRRYSGVLEEVSPNIKRAVKYLLNVGLTPEEALGIICGEATLLVSAEAIAKKLNNNKEEDSN